MSKQLVKEDNIHDLEALRMQNKKAVIGFALVNVIIAIAYFLEVIKGARSVQDYSIVAMLALLPTIVSIVVNKINPVSYRIKYISTYTFCIMYAYIMFTTNKYIAFCYVLLVFTLATIYADIKLSAVCSVIALLINIGAVAKLALTTGLTDVQITEWEIIIACVLLAGIFAILATTTTDAVNKRRMTAIQKEKEQASHMLDTIMTVSQSLIENIDKVAAEMEQVSLSVNATKASMDDVATGSSETSTAIQIQQEHTAEIERQILAVKDASLDITNNVTASAEMLAEGQATMNNLMEQVAITETVSKQVASEMEQLKTYTGNMQNIMELINSVAAQTGLLALNASIEAARAGEAGRGFAVVATEISNLSSQTSTATDDINNIIENISASLNQVVGSVTQLLEGNSVQNQQVVATAEQLDKIQEATTNVYNNAQGMNDLVSTVAEANEVIVDSISNISAVTEELTARATETLNGTTDDMKRIEMISDIVTKLHENAQELKNV